jgi:DNA invertase Pin-like site-specific DNA recombinase
MNNDQIHPTHFARLAYVYIRQSSMQQVRQHTESQHRQRQLVQRAVALGWAAEQVVVIDEDLGQSAAATGQRSGFERLIGEVAVGGVGVILSLEASRISRDNSRRSSSSGHLRDHPDPHWRRRGALRSMRLQ